MDDSTENPVIIGGVEEYSSSEEIQRAHRTFIQDEERKKEEERQLTDKQRLHKVLDKYIAKHSTTKAVRERLRESGKKVSGKALEVQFEVSDAIVTELEKIKNELR